MFNKRIDKMMNGEEEPLFDPQQQQQELKASRPTTTHAFPFVT
jgi:hypothetical protein